MEAKRLPSRLVGIHGKMGAGKSTFARILLTALTNSTGEGANRWHISSFANRLKRTVETMFNLPPGFLATTEGKGTFSPITCCTYGALLQRIGQGMRDTLGSQIWIDLLLDADADFLIIDDVRYRTEAEAIRERGGMLIKIMVRSPGTQPILPVEAGRIMVRSPGTQSILSVEAERIIREVGGSEKEIAGRDTAHISEVDLDGCDSLFDFVLSFPFGALFDMQIEAEGIAALLR